MELPKIYLKSQREQSLLRRHPWVFSGAIATMDPKLNDGDLVNVYDHHQSLLAFGHFYKGSIAIKILSFGDKPYHPSLWKDKLALAYHLRMGLIHSGLLNSDAWRWVNGEGDGLPGLIVDRYGSTVVIQCHTIGMHRSIELIAEAILQCDADGIQCIYDKSKESLPPEYASNMENRAVFGELNPCQIKEHGLNYLIDPVTGQKTGFFLDQRDNRALVKSWSQGKRVLNTYSYTGGFSLAALAGGAAEVCSVDVSGRAMELLDRNLALNELQASNHTSIVADVPAFLKDQKKGHFDLIILDPPAFAKSIHKRHNAIKAYTRLNQAALQLIDQNGLLFTFSCSQVVTEELFFGAVSAAAMEVGRNVRLLARLGQGPDHPVNFFHPEGHYLKGLLLYVE